MLAETLSDIFQRGLEFAYDCEQHLIKTLPKFIESVRSQELKAAFERQLEESKQQLTRLDEVFASLNRAAATENNRSVESILAEGEKLIKHIDASPLRDAALIITGNLVQHNEIALYGSLTALAKVLGFEQCGGIAGEVAERGEGDRSRVDRHRGEGESGSGGIPEQTPRLRDHLNVRP